MDDAINTNLREKSHGDARGIQNFPSQLTKSMVNIGICDSPGTVPYLSPSKMRLVLESYVEEYGEEILERTKLQRLDPTVFFNLWWFSARFSLPLPLSVVEISLCLDMPSQRFFLQPRINILLQLVKFSIIINFIFI